LIFLANLGASMIQEPSPDRKARDIEAICQIANELLRDKDLLGMRGTLGILALNFLKWNKATVDELL
jgi:hypothetical protein